jgi:hypothetical protein
LAGGLKVATTNKKITELPELTEANLSDDDVLAIVDISAGTTNKVRKSTLASALSGVATLTATSPVTVSSSTGNINIALTTVPVANGGTGATSFTNKGVLLGGTTVSSTIAGSSGQVLTSNGSGTAPTFQVPAESGGGLFKGDNGTTGNTTTGPKDIFRINEQELNTSTSITSAENASACGPLALASGVTLTVAGNLSII